MTDPLILMTGAAALGGDFPPGVDDTPANRELWERIRARIAADPSAVVGIPWDYADDEPEPTELAATPQHIHIPGTDYNWRHTWIPITAQAARVHWRGHVPASWAPPGGKGTVGLDKGAGEGGKVSDQVKTAPADVAGSMTRPEGHMGVWHAGTVSKVVQRKMPSGNTQVTLTVNGTPWKYLRGFDPVPARGDMVRVSGMPIQPSGRRSYESNLGAADIKVITPASEIRKLKPGQEIVHDSGVHHGVKWERITRKPAGLIGTVRSLRLTGPDGSTHTMLDSDSKDPLAEAAKMAGDIASRPARQAEADRRQHEAVMEVAHEQLARDREHTRLNPLGPDAVTRAWSAAHGGRKPPTADYRRWNQSGVTEAEHNSPWYQAELKRQADAGMLSPGDTRPGALKATPAGIAAQAVQPAPVTGWGQLHEGDAATLKPGDQFFTPSMGSVVRVGKDGSVSEGRGSFVGPDGTTWQVTARDGSKVTAVSHDGRTVTQDTPPGQKVLKVAPSAPAPPKPTRGVRTGPSSGRPRGGMQAAVRRLREQPPKPAVVPEWKRIMDEQAAIQKAAGKSNAQGMARSTARYQAGQVHLHEATGLTAPHVADVKVLNQGAYNQAVDALHRGDYAEGLARLDEARVSEPKPNAKLDAFRAKVAKAAAHPKMALPALARVPSTGGRGGFTALDHTGREYRIGLRGGTVSVTATDTGRTFTAPAGENPTQVARQLAARHAPGTPEELREAEQAVVAGKMLTPRQQEVLRQDNDRLTAQASAEYRAART